MVSQDYRTTNNIVKRACRLSITSSQDTSISMSNMLSVQESLTIQPRLSEATLLLVLVVRVVVRVVMDVGISLAFTGNDAFEPLVLLLLVLTVWTFEATVLFRSDRLVLMLVLLVFAIRVT